MLKDSNQHYGSLDIVIAQSAPAVNPDGTPCGEVVDLLAAMRSGQRPNVVGL